MENSIFEVLKLQSVQINEKPYPDLFCHTLTRQNMSTTRVDKTPTTTFRGIQPNVPGKIRIGSDPNFPRDGYSNSLKSGFSHLFRLSTSSEKSRQCLYWRNTFGETIAKNCPSRIINLQRSAILTQQKHGNSFTTRQQLGIPP